MQRPVSMIWQSSIAAVVVAVGAGLWVAREPVSAAVSGLFVSGGAAKAGGKRGRGGRGGRGGSVPVVLDRVGEGRDDLAFSGIGTARALRHVTLYAAVSGEVVKVHTHAGDRVEKGAAIIELDTRQVKLAIEMARSKLDNAQRLVSRADRLHRSNVQSQARVQDAETVADQARVELETAKVALTDHTISAPFAGVVGIAQVEVGDRVSAQKELVTLDDRARLTVEFEVPETFLPRLSAGVGVDVRTPGFANRKFAGRIERIDSRVHPTRRTVLVRALVDNGEDLLRPGMSFEVDLRMPGKPFPKVPDLALQFSQNGNYVWLIDGDQKAARVPVKIVRRNANTVLVYGKIGQGDRIVIEGVQRLKPGAKVTIAENAAAPAAASPGPRKEATPAAAAEVRPPTPTRTR